MLEFNSRMRNCSEYWNFRTKLGINENVEIWVLIVKSIKMLILEWKVGNQSKSWSLSAIGWKLIKMLKFECKMSNRSKCWNLSTRCARSKCWNLSEKRENRSNVDILLQKWKLIKILEFDWKLRNWSEWDNVGNWSKCWNLSVKCHFNQMLKFEWKGDPDWSKC